MAASEQTQAATENRHHHYTTHRIPWYVHLIWVTFWILCISYTLAYIFPEIQREFRKAQAPAPAGVEK